MNINQPMNMVFMDQEAGTPVMYGFLAAGEPLPAIGAAVVLSRVEGSEREELKTGVVSSVVYSYTLEHPFIKVDSVVVWIETNISEGEASDQGMAGA